MADRERIWRGMIGGWQDERDLKRRGSCRSVNRHDTSRVAAYLNQEMSGLAAPAAHLDHVMPKNLEAQFAIWPPRGIIFKEDCLKEVTEWKRN